MNILFIGDIVGAYGRAVIKHLLPNLKKELHVDLTIANGENSAHGYSMTEKIYNQLLGFGIDIFTMGNHTWEKKELVKNISSLERIVRPANYPPGVPGKGYLILNVNGTNIAIVNLLGRVFMQCMDCPFQAVDKLFPKLKAESDIIIVDVHAEATSEKYALGYYLDGQATAVIGTHTHVLTSDERIFPRGTAYISDIGMVGALDSVIGMKKEQILKRFVTQLPEKFEPADSGPGLFNAVLIKIDPNTKKAQGIERVVRVTESLTIEKEKKK